MSLAESDKTTHWCFTAYEEQWPMFVLGKRPPYVSGWGWQQEICPKTSRPHYQGWMTTKAQHRYSPAGMENGVQKFKPAGSLLRLFPGTHIEPVAKEDWPRVKNYCRKLDTRAPGTEPVQEIATYDTMYSYSDELLERLPDWDVVREMWMAFTTLNSREQYRRQASLAELGLKYYSSPEDYAYGELLQQLLNRDIESGRIDCSYMSKNPLFVVHWKSNIKHLIISKTPRFNLPLSIKDRQTNPVTISFA